MECGDEEASSLLSLSQSFLQPDSSSTSMSLSGHQFHNWSSLTPNAADVASQFSPISPADGYTNSTSNGHTTIDDTNFRFYGGRNNGSQQTVDRNNGFRSTNPNVASVVDPEMAQSSVHLDMDGNITLAYEHTSATRAAASLYRDKDLGYFSKNSSGGSLDSTSHQPEPSDMVSSGYTQGGYPDSNMLNLVSGESDHRLVNRNLQLDQKAVDSKTKDYSKDLSNIYDQPQEKVADEAEVNMTFDRRDPDSYATSFEFTSDSHDFAATSRSFSGQDYPLSQKYVASQLADNDLLYSSLSLDSKRGSSTFANFDLRSQNEGMFNRLSNSQNKSVLAHQLGELSSDLEPMFHGYSTDVGVQRKLAPDSHRNFQLSQVQGSLGANHLTLQDSNNSKDRKWSGRPRAHRKMARLLGGGGERDYCNLTTDPYKPAVHKKLAVSEAASLTTHQQNVPRDFTTGTRTFFTVEEELDLRTCHHQHRSFVASRQEDSSNRNLASQKDLGLLQAASSFSFDSSNMASSTHKESSLLSSQPFLTPGQLDIDFQSSLSVGQSHKDLDLSHHLGLHVPAHSATAQDDLPFMQSADPSVPHHADLSLPDNLGITPHGNSDLNFDAYLNSAAEKDFSCATERDLSFGKRSAISSRDITYVSNTGLTDFNIEDYVNPHRDLSQAYLTRPDLPQDMTIYQKPSAGQSLLPETFTALKGPGKVHSIVSQKGKPAEMSELQKELTKSSTKESLKGIRIPRDINRAMEILQGLQEDEKEEERRREQRQQENQQQLQSLVSNPKKTFQAKHVLETLNLPDQHFLSANGSFMEEPVEGNFIDSSLDHSISEHLHLSGSQPYQPYTQTQQGQVSVSSLGQTRDAPLDAPHRITTELDYQERLTGPSSTKLSSCTALNSAHLVSMLVDNSAHEASLQYSDSGFHFPVQQSNQESLASLSTNGGEQWEPNYSTEPTLDLNRSKHDVPFSDCLSLNVAYEKPQTAIGPFLTPPCTLYSKYEAEVIVSSRRNLYNMMKEEQFCDAILYTPKQTVKMHQVVLCSMSEYLTTLLQKMKPSLGSTRPSITASSSSYFTSQLIQNCGILLVINCDGIKSSSMSAFLMYVYLGRAELSQTNVLDMYILACSLRVSSLKNLCQEFMWQADIPSEQVKVPQLLVSVQRLEMQDKCTSMEVSKQEKATTASTSCVRLMEVSTQTDRSMSEVGGGGQEEWVMLKKTKQKTVSPSKSRLVGRSSSGSDSPIGGKVGKKTWLSPKRRYKTEIQVQEKKVTNNISDIDQEMLLAFYDIAHVEKKNEVVKETHSAIDNSVSETEVQNVSPELSNQRLESRESSESVTPPTQLPMPQKTLRTTVEIAAAVAAAKLITSLNSARPSRGSSRTPQANISVPASLDKKKLPCHKTSLALSKKKDFIKSNTQHDSSQEKVKSDVTGWCGSGACDGRVAGSSRSSTELSITRAQPAADGSLTLTEKLKHSSDHSSPSVQRPIKKSFVHRSRSEELFNNSHVQSSGSEELFNNSHVQSSYSEVLFNNIHVQSSGSEELFNSSHVQSSNSLPGKVSDVSSGCDQDFIDSDLIDSIVKTVESDTAEVDFQKVIRDLDTLNKSPMFSTASPSASSLLLSSPLKSLTPQASVTDSSPIKSGPTPQGFRKRLIHQVNAEKISSNDAASTVSQQTTKPVTSKSHAADPALGEASTATSAFETTSESVSSVPDLLLVKHSAASRAEVGQTSSSDKESTSVFQKDNTEISAESEPKKDNLTAYLTDGVDELVLSLYSIGVDAEQHLLSDDKASTFSAMTDIDLGLRHQSESQFSHKNFKQKKRTKHRKLAAVVDDETAATKVKPRKQSPASFETIGVTTLAKAKVRRMAGSDAEGSLARSRLKKLSTEGVVGLGKVRPPPKKRAKMELALLHSKDSDKCHDLKTDSLRMTGLKDSDEILDLKEDNIRVIDPRNLDKCLDLKADSLRKIYPKDSDNSLDLRDDSLRATCLDKDPSQTEIDAPARDDKFTSSTSEAGETVEGQAPGKEPTDAELVNKKESSCKEETRHDCSKTSESSKQGKAKEVTLETRLTQVLQGMAQLLVNKGRLFSCQLCQTEFRSARRAIKHMQSHGPMQEDVLNNIGVGQRQTSLETCKLCGYKTKDKSFHYMHLHKYFKHGLPLPQGWSTDKCEVCGKECFNKSQLKEHMMSHDEKHFYVCWHCGLSFKMRNSMNNHIFHQHTSTRKHQCKVCEKAFKTWTQLKVHVRSHTGDRPFECPDCGHRTTTQGNLKLHLGTHGFSKEKIQELTQQISQNVPEMNPESLEQVMLGLKGQIQVKQTSTAGQTLEHTTKRAKVKRVSQMDSVTEKDNPPNKRRKGEKKPRAKKQQMPVPEIGGSHMKYLFSQPLKKLKSSPQSLMPQLLATAAHTDGNTDHRVAEQMQTNTQLPEPTQNSTNLLLPKRQSSQLASPTNGTFFIAVPFIEQQLHTQQPVHLPSTGHQPTSSASSMMGYTVIPTYILSNQLVGNTSLTSAPSLLPLSMISTPQNFVQPVVQPSLQIVQLSGVHTENTATNCAK